MMPAAMVPVLVMNSVAESFRSRAASSNGGPTGARDVPDTDREVRLTFANPVEVPEPEQDPVQFAVLREDELWENAFNRVCKFDLATFMCFAPLTRNGVFKPISVSG